MQQWTVVTEIIGGGGHFMKLVITDNLSFTDKYSDILEFDWLWSTVIDCCHGNSQWMTNVTGDNGFRQKSGILKIQFFIESRCPPPKLSNDIKYLYSPALDMRIKSKNQCIFLCLSLAKFWENGHVRFCFLTKDNVSAAMRHVRGENHPSIRYCQSILSSASSNHSAFLLVHWYNKSFRIPSSDFGVRSRNTLEFPSVCLPITSFKMVIWASIVCCTAVRGRIADHFLIGGLISDTIVSFIYSQMHIFAAQ